MTTEHQASRTLVKSPPELWAECSDPGSLARHLDWSFGEIRITRLEPENAVAWEGENASGTVQIEPSGWGTRVTLTAETTTELVVEPEPAAEAPSEGAAEEEPEPVIERSTADAAASLPLWRQRIRNRIGALLRAKRASHAPEPEPIGPKSAEPGPVEPESVDAESAEPQPVEIDAVESEPEPELVEPVFDPEAALTAALDSLGRAHHRPFSRA